MTDKCETCGATLCPDCKRGDCAGESECIEAKIKRLEAENAELKMLLTSRPVISPLAPMPGLPLPFPNWNPLDFRPMCESGQLNAPLRMIEHDGIRHPV